MISSIPSGVEERSVLFGNDLSVWTDDSVAMQGGGDKDAFASRGGHREEYIIDW